MDLLKTLYEVLGSSYPRLSIVVAAALGAAIFGGAWWLIGKQYQKEQHEAAAALPVSAGPKQPSASSSISPSSPVVSPPASQTALDAVSPLAAADKAGEHYRQTSVTIKKEEIRQSYRALCDRIADRFGLKSWAPLNHLTKMIDTNLGDMDAFTRAEKELPGSALVALRVLVAFETTKERPMYMSYAFIGRTADGEEIVALLNEAREWSVLSKSSESRANHEELLIDIVLPLRHQ